MATADTEGTAQVEQDHHAETMLLDHINGGSYRDIGRRYGLSHEGARQVIVRQATKFVDRIELDLLLGTKTDEWPTFLVADKSGEDWQMILHLVAWLIGRLRERDIAVKVETRTTEAGMVLMLIEETP